MHEQMHWNVLTVVFMSLQLGQNTSPTRDKFDSVGRSYCKPSQTIVSSKRVSSKQNT